MEVDRKIIVGFKTIVLGLCLYVIELLSLPVFGTLQKAQVNGDGFILIFGSKRGNNLIPLSLC